MLQTSSTLPLFPEQDAVAARALAVDKLHAATSLYTRQPIVDSIIDRLSWHPGTGCLADVSAGDGIFLGEALNRLLASASRTDDQIASSIQGYEIHPAAAAQARARLEAILISGGRPAPAARHLSERIVHHRDFLTDGPAAPRYSHICGNPPFLRLPHVPQLLRDEYKALVPHYANSDLLYAFLDRISKTLKPGGEICLVSNDRWLFAKGAAELRQTIGVRCSQDGTRLSLQHVERLDNKSAFYRPKHRAKGTPPRISPVVVHLGFGVGRELSKDPIYPGVDHDEYAHFPKLGDIAAVSLGPWLGQDGRHVLTQDEALRSNIPRDDLIPTVDARDVVGGVLQAPKRYALIVSPGKSPAPLVQAHLEATAHLMSARRRRTNSHLPPETVHNRDLSKRSLMILRITNTAKPIRVPSGVLINDHHLGITCENDDLLDQIERALHGELANKWLAAHSSPLEGGYYQVNAPMLRQLPIELS